MYFVARKLPRVSHEAAVIWLLCGTQLGYHMWLGDKSRNFFAERLYKYNLRLRVSAVIYGIQLYSYPEELINDRGSI